MPLVVPYVPDTLPYRELGLLSISSIVYLCEREQEKRAKTSRYTPNGIADSTGWPMDKFAGWAPMRNCAYIGILLYLVVCA